MITNNHGAKKSSKVIHSLLSSFTQKSPKTVQSHLNHHTSSSSLFFNKFSTSQKMFIGYKEGRKPLKAFNQERNPFDDLHQYKQRSQQIKYYEDMEDDETISFTNIIREQNIEMLESLRAQGKGPLDEFIPEEPSIKEFTDYMMTEKPKEGEWSPHKPRVGLLARKVGMFASYDYYTCRMPITVLYVPRCCVTQIKTNEKEGYTAMQIGVGYKSLKRTTRPLLGHFAKAGVEPKDGVLENKVHEESLLPLGFELDVRHFIPGQYVDVTGRTTGKGFQGTIKRHGFSRQPATHGNSKTTRLLGSTGNLGAQRVWKGKKMPGRMGGTQKTHLNMYIHSVDYKNSLIYVKGSIQGQKGSYVLLRDAKRKIPEHPLPYPTFFKDPNEDVSTMTTEECTIKHKGERRPADWDYTEMKDEEIEKRLKELLGKRFLPDPTPKLHKAYEGQVDFNKKLRF